MFALTPKTRGSAAHFVLVFFEPCGDRMFAFTPAAAASAAAAAAAAAEGEVLLNLFLVFFEPFGDRMCAFTLKS